MKAITKAILVLAAIGGVISGCATKSEFKDLKKRMDVLESNKIQSIEGQISSIDTSIGLLDQTDDQLDGYIKALKEQVLELEDSTSRERETLEAAIKALQTEDESLHKQMEELKAYVDTELNGVKDWASATFVTLEEYNKTVDVIADIQANLDTLHTSITNEYQQAIEDAIGKSAESMKLWVNEQLTGYYDIATMNTKLDSLKSAIGNQINEQGDDLKELIGQNTKDIETLESDLKQAKTDITDAYKKAIEEAITKYDGTITGTIQNAIDVVNTKIKGLDKRVTDLETKVVNLEKRMDEVEKALKSLVSVTYIPKYSDNKERVKYIFNGTKYITSDLNLRFDVYPAIGAQAIADAYAKDKSIVSARAVYTLTKVTAGDFVNLSVSDVSASSDGILTVIVSPDGLDKDFFDGKYEASLVLKISTGYNNIQSDYIGLVPASVRELSVSESANCYLVQAAGDYEFKAVQGNTFKKGDSGKTGTPVGTVASVDVLWESFGTSTAPEKGDIISSVSYSSDGYIQFSTPADFKQGNAVIAAKDKDGVILWSWHIWCAQEGWKEQVYYKNAGTMMDRNLGATTAEMNTVGSLGLLYQWGRKDPFLGASELLFSSQIKQAASTGGKWETSSDAISAELSTENPMTFYKGDKNYMPNKSWDSEKTVNDPCPAGWRVPDGGDNGVWAKANGSSEYKEPIKTTSLEYGLNFGKVFGSDETIWYPTSGCVDSYTGLLYEACFVGWYWAVTPSRSYNSSHYAKNLQFTKEGAFFPSTSMPCPIAMSVRCLKE